MRTLYPVKSQELNDAFLDAYAKLVYLIGREDEETHETTYSGLYDDLEATVQELIFQYVLLRPDYYPEDGTDICGDVLSVNHRKQLRRM